MTLLTTEIHNHNDPEAVVVFAADRRISRGDSHEDTKEKIFNIPGLHAGIGYFGLAEVPDGQRPKPMAEWLQDFLNNSGPWTEMKEFAEALSASLNRIVPLQLRKSTVSGFHVAGFSSNGQVEFWFIRNVDDDRKTLFGEYRIREDFQGRDAPRLEPGRYQIYRNGDMRAHVTFWEKIDHALGILLKMPDFRSLSKPDDYVDWVKFKMETIARFYETFCNRSIIGGPVDAFAITRPVKAIQTVRAH